MWVDKSKLKPLAKCSKEHNMDGNEIEPTDQISEWVFMSALWNLSDREYVSEKDITDEVEKIHMEYVLSKMVDDGLLEMHFEEKTGEASYSLTELGKKMAKERQ